MKMYAITYYSPALKTRRIGMFFKECDVEVAYEEARKMGDDARVEDMTDHYQQHRSEYYVYSSSTRS